MRSIVKNISIAIPALLIALLFTQGCKPKQKIVTPPQDVVEAGKTDAEISLAKNQLRRLLTDENMSAAELEAQLAAIKAAGHTNPEVLDLITQVEGRIATKKTAEATETKNRSMGTSPDAIVESFGAISKSADYDTANDVINGMLSRFESPDTPVLIIVAEDQGVKDYDKPTTIQKYLEYIKMQKRYESKVEEVVRNTDGKITRLVLRK
jgi:hypothetical protein